MTASLACPFSGGAETRIRMAVSVTDKGISPSFPPFGVTRTGNSQVPRLLF